MALASLPGLDLYRIRLARDTRDSYEFILGAGGNLTHHLYIDPYARRVLGVRVAGSDPFLWLQSLHFDLLGGTTGRRVNGYVAATVLLLGAAGLLLWLDAGGSWRARLRPRLRARPARRNWGAHVAGGIWTLPFLTLMASTALYFAFHEPVANFVYQITRTKGPAPLPRIEASPERVPLDGLLARARDFEPNATFTLIRLPRAKQRHIALNYFLPGDLSDLGANAIHFNPATGAFLRSDRLRDMELGPRIVAALVPLHFGTFGGLPTRMLWAALGQLPLILFITGIAIARRRRSYRLLRAREMSIANRLQSASSASEVHTS